MTATALRTLQPTTRGATVPGLPKYTSPDWQHTHGFYRFLYRTIRYPLKWFFRVHARGFSNVPREGGVIVAMNHFSWIDPLMAAHVLPRPIFFLAKEELFDGRFRRWFMEGMGQIEVDRRTGGNDAALNVSQRLLKDGCMVGVYPEGTRSTYGDLLRPKRGVARLAMTTGAPVVPVALLTHHVWPKGPLLPNLGERVYVNVGRPMRFQGKASLAQDKEATQEVANLVMDRVSDLLDEAETAYQGRERWGW